MTKEINELTQDRIGDDLFAAMKREGLMNKEVAEILGISPVDMSNLKRHQEKVTQPGWTKIRNWMISGLPLRAYKPKPPADFIPAPQTDEVTAETTLTPAAAKFVAERKKRDEIAERVRETYNMEKGIKVPRRKLEEIDPATGELLASITIDTYRDYFLIRVKR
jgi:hypothetical protein